MTHQLAPNTEAAIARLASAPVGSYAPGGEAASEPTAWGAIALAAAGRTTEAIQAADWLVGRQVAAGSVGVTESQDDPAWTTALAMLAWRTINADRYADCIEQAAEWALGQEPTTIPRDPIFEHDTTIEGWSWAPHTHSWLEPTAFYSIALRECGYADHPRRAEAVRLLVDRLLPIGGANYGNTLVFDQMMQQHVHSSGVAAWALAGEEINDPRLGLTLDYLEDSLTQQTGAASLAWAVRGLAANNRASDLTHKALSAAWPRLDRSSSHHKLALFTLACQAARVGRSEQSEVRHASL